MTDSNTEEIIEELPHCEFQLQIDFSYDNTILSSPSFRCMFLSKENRIETKNASIENGWKEIKEENEGPFLRYKETFKNYQITTELLQNINENPLLTFILTNGKENQYYEFFLMDLSPLLNGEMNITSLWKDQKDETSEIYGICSKGIKKLRLSLIVDIPIIPPQMKLKLEPLVIEIKKGILLPSKETTETQAYVQLCFPTSSFRIRRTIAVPMDRTVRWNYQIVLLLGLLPEQYKEELEVKGIKAEFHDDDSLAIENEVFERLQKKWNQRILETEGSNRVVAEVPKTGKKKDGKEISHSNDAGIFEFDEAVIEELQEFYKDTSSRNFYGLATIKLNDAFNMKSTREKVVHDVRIAIVPQRPRKNDTLELKNKVDSMVRRDYLECETQLCVRWIYSRVSPPVAIEQSVAADTNKETSRIRFGRSVLCFEYDDKSFFQFLNLIETHNCKAIEKFQNQQNTNSSAAAECSISLRTYQMSAAEIEAAVHGELDIITGFQVINGTDRILLAEGIDSTLHSILPCNGKIISSKDLTFTTRLYLSFGVNLKCIRLSQTLESILLLPSVYSTLSSTCQNALFSIKALRDAQSLQECKDYNYFPDANGISEVENKFGDVVSLQDMYGLTTPKTQTEEKSEIPEESGINEGKENKDVEKGSRVKAAIDNTNKKYEEMIKTRVTKDYIAEEKEKLRIEKEKYEQKKLERMREPSNEKVYMYSGQRLQNSELQLAELRERLGKKKDVSYTYSADFQSLSMSMVDEGRMEKEAEIRSKEKWVTSRGFVYPAPRCASECRKLKEDVSDYRKEELQQPWIPPNESVEEDSDESEEKKFSTLPSRDMIFGWKEQDGTPNPAYFKSVHLIDRHIIEEKDEKDRMAKLERVEKQRKEEYDKRHSQKNIITKHTIKSSASPKDTKEIIQIEEKKPDQKQKDRERDFHIPHQSQVLVPKPSRITSKLPIRPLSDAEKRGPLWG